MFQACLVADNRQRKKNWIFTEFTIKLCKLRQLNANNAKRLLDNRLIVKEIPSDWGWVTVLIMFHKFILQINAIITDSCNIHI